jgi:hypothetical protein
MKLYFHSTVCQRHLYIAPVYLLRYLGIQGAMANWFESYLTDRKQKTEIRLPNAIQSTFSKWGTIENEFHKGQP